MELDQIVDVSDLAVSTNNSQLHFGAKPAHSQVSNLQRVQFHTITSVLAALTPDLAFHSGLRSLLARCSLPASC
jgi:hypothetical protein